ncbi:MAG: hypothetical protein M1837_000786 [Sclerophora amabilis]|nr:MAG: hypothetical protein M1837_000786 [Sclerophora amabilis]
MKFRRKPSPLILCLLPSLVSSFNLAGEDTTNEVSTGQQPVVRDVPQAVAAPKEDVASTQNSKIKSDVGTKDAPVDGQDGKPHAGPWVEAGSEKDKQNGAGVDDEQKPVAGKKPAPRPLKDPPLPEANDGVMDDPNRDAPKKGTTGTEGGVSEKDKNRKAQEGGGREKAEKKPDPPKEAPPLPHSEQEKIKLKEGDKDSTKDKDKDTEKDVKDVKEEDSEKAKDLGGLEKPADLPEKPHDIPHPPPPTSPKDQDLDSPKSEPGSQHDTESFSGDEASGLIQPLHSFFLSFTMILFSEIGDKTFLVAALMAMKHPRLVVFSAAFSALIGMTILSAVLGHAVPTLIPKRFTNFLAAALFLVFGARMLREGYGISPDEGVSEEMKEVEMELEVKEHQARRKGRRSSTMSPYILEAGGGGNRKSRSNSRLPSPPRSPSSSSSRSPSPVSGSTVSKLSVGLTNLFSLLLSPAWVQTFVMTFLGEWGDRSQIATIAMAAGQDYWWVTGGAVCGHGVCTAAAVIGGRAVAGRVSLRVVTLGGAFAFLIFGLIYLLEAFYYT